MKNWREMFYGLKLTEEQMGYVEAMIEGRQHTKKKFLIGVNAGAGSGKTTLAVGSAHYLQMELLYVFNPTEEDKMGFRPGDQRMKELEYVQPLRDALLAIGQNPLTAIKPFEDADLLRDKVEAEMIEEFEKPQKGKKKQKFHQPRSSQDKYWVEAKSHIFARGTNIKKKFVVIDEAQNWTEHDLKKLLTRCDDDCIVVVIGHTGQIDLKKPSQSGFNTFLNYFIPFDYYANFALTKNFRGRLSKDADNMC
jgi:phosphate starvation-inducible protein PhoH and related proteins